MFVSRERASNSVIEIGRLAIVVSSALFTTVKYTSESQYEQDTPTSMFTFADTYVCKRQILLSQQQ